jgi:hypothetical protein
MYRTRLHWQLRYLRAWTRHARALQLFATRFVNNILTVTVS